MKQNLGIQGILSKSVGTSGLGNINNNILPTNSSISNSAALPGIGKI
jgi:hypothetical protein